MPLVKRPGQVYGGELERKRGRGESVKDEMQGHRHKNGLGGITLDRRGQNVVQA